MKCTLIINPRSGNGKSKRHSSSIIRQCRDSGMIVNEVFASGYEDMRKCSVEANARKDDIVVAVGGDGTINAVMNGFYDDEGNRMSDCKFGVVYTGTSPDFCKSYGIPLDHKKAIDNLVAAKSRRIFPGKISLMTGKGTGHFETRYFACCANIGIGAGIARDSNRIRRYTGDLAGTFISLIGNLLKHRPGNIFLEIDRECSCVTNPVNISVGRTPYIASGIRVTGSDILDQPKFYILVASNLSFTKLPGLLKQAYSGNIGNSDYLRLMEGRTIRLDSEEPGVEVEFDGDPAGYLPCVIDQAKETIDLVIG